MTTSSDPAGEAAPARPPAALWGILGSGFLIRLLLAFQNPSTLVTLNIPDDAFYYFKIAQNIAMGRGSSFDGIHPTNGYHPLWMGFLVPIFRIVPNQLELAVRLGLTEQALLDLVTALLVYFLAQAMLSNRRWAVLAAALYFLNPHTVLDQMNGMETTVSTLMGVVVLYFFVLLQAPSPGARLPRIRFAVACGLLLLARTDNIFLCLVLFVALAWQEWKLQASLRRTFGMGLTVCAIVTPWLVWNYTGFHQLVQVSGWARPWVNRQKAGAAWIVLGLKLFRQEITVRWSQLSCLLTGYFVLWGFSWLLLKRRNARPKDRIQERGLKALALAWVGLVLTLAFHCFVRLTPRPWYSAPFLVLNALSIAWAGRRIWGLPKARRAVSVVLAAIFAAYILSAVRFVRFRPLSWQREMLRSAQWLSLHTPPSARVGSFNAGIIGFFAHRTVVNLDGVVNNSAFTALRARRLGDYLAANSIEYVTDFKYAVDVDYADFWGTWPDHTGLVPEASFPVGGAQFRDSFMQVYRVAPRSAPPASPVPLPSSPCLRAPAASVKPGRSGPGRSADISARRPS